MMPQSEMIIYPETAPYLDPKFSIMSIKSKPVLTYPKTTLTLLSQGVFRVVMLNYEEFVLGPLLFIMRR